MANPGRSVCVCLYVCVCVSAAAAVAAICKYQKQFVHTETHLNMRDLKCIHSFSTTNRRKGLLPKSFLIPIVYIGFAPAVLIYTHALTPWPF